MKVFGGILPKEKQLELCSCRFFPPSQCKLQTRRPVLGTKFIFFREGIEGEICVSFAVAEAAWYTARKPIDNSRRHVVYI